VAQILPNGADLHAKYANGVALVRDHDYSVCRAAKRLGISPTHLTRKLNAIGSKGDLQKIAEAVAAQFNIEEEAAGYWMVGGALPCDEALRGWIKTYKVELSSRTDSKPRRQRGRSRADLHDRNRRPRRPVARTEFWESLAAIAGPMR
jgi:hypothetical protein